MKFKIGYVKPLSMLTVFLTLLTIIHFISMAGLSVYGLHRIWLLWNWYRIPKGMPKTEEMKAGHFPFVTIQIPLYNEPRVAGRIIDAAAAIDWPIDKLQIQVLDDSDDHTRCITAERETYWSSRGLNLGVIRRTRRTGYKAGALAVGLKQATGEFIAVFDADFIPSANFLKKTIPHFSSDDIGMIQSRWGFLNAGFTWLTRIQSLLLSAHFGVEHAVRYHQGLFFNFNGTAGVWRRSAIIDAGGWQSDTVTEDLDLSYRAQLAGWRFVYLHDVVVPSELPITISAFRCQQKRWSKGAIQTARKILPRVITAPVPFAVKLETAAHLLANCCWMFGFLVTLTLFPVLINRIGIGINQVLWWDVPLFLLTGGAVLIYYGLYGWRSGMKRYLIILPLLLAASIGLAPYFSFAVLSGILQNGGIFARTPKFGILDGVKNGPLPTTFNRYHLVNLCCNLIFFAYLWMPVCLSLSRETWTAVPFLCLFPVGFLLIIVCDIRECLVGWNQNSPNRISTEK